MRELCDFGFNVSAKFMPFCVYLLFFRRNTDRKNRTVNPASLGKNRANHRVL